MPDRQPAKDRPSFPDVSASIGSRIRDLRAERGISLGSLAVTTGLGKGTLSELERGRRNPTLDTLFAIATALTVPLSDLLLMSGDTAVGSAAAGDGPRAHGQSVDARLIGRWRERAEVVEVYRMAIGPGRRESRRHSDGVVESITVIDGEIAVGSVAAPVRLRGGDSHTFPGDVDHVYEGVGDHPASTVLVMRYPTEPASSG